MPIATVLIVGALWGASFFVEISSADPGDRGRNAFDDAAKWGGDHVGFKVPDYGTGDECLFCHRDRFGADWSRNAHQRTMRPVDQKEPSLAALKGDAATRSLADQVEFLMGDRRQVRFLKRGADYGKLALLSAKFAPPPPGKRSRRVHGSLNGAKDVHWDDRTFAQQCAGCHTTGVDPQMHAFSATSIDCYACHGIVETKHPETRQVFLAKGRHDPPWVDVSICAQCHLRTGRSRATGLPYPTNFVAGDNLFRDFQVSLTDADLANMNPADRHVAQTVREAVLGKSNTTCVTCHDVHRQTAVKHHSVVEGATCATCHKPGRPRSEHIRYEVHSSLCGY